MRHDISFRRDGVEVLVEVGTDLPHADSTCDTLFRTRFNAGTVANAELWMRYLSERHYAALRAIRQAAYLKGWLDAKAKKGGKQNYFAGTMDPKFV
ncbi:MAG: hypothetical protein IMZ50_15575 [Candidatus Atribacteria bacterium]|nr:hypothetical protein [Candidatus Atribacteria bacterium]